MIVYVIIDEDGDPVVFAQRDEAERICRDLWGDLEMLHECRIAGAA